MPAKMLAAAARFRRSNDPVAIPGTMRCAYFSIAGIPDRSGTSNCNRPWRSEVPQLRACVLSICGQALRQVHEPLFKFAAENRGYAERAKIVNVHGSVETVAAEVRGWILFPKQGNEFAPRGVYMVCIEYYPGVAVAALRVLRRSSMLRNAADRVLDRRHHSGEAADGTPSNRSLIGP